MDEKILVTDAGIINNILGEDSEHIIQISYDAFIHSIKNSYRFIDRSIAESDRRYMQIIPYCLVAYANEVFLVRRTNKQTESRLHDYYSVGIGGHINSYDTLNDSIESILEAGLLRELHEEVKILCPYHYEYFGIINDNTSDVNTVHLGLCFIVTLEEKECSVREIEKMDGQWIKISDIDPYYENMERWSQILIKSFL